MRIVDDDVSWNSIAAAQEKEQEEEDAGDMPVVSGEPRPAQPSPRLVSPSGQRWPSPFSPPPLWGARSRRGGVAQL